MLLALIFTTEQQEKRVGRREYRLRIGWKTYDVNDKSNVHERSSMKESVLSDRCECR